jgi:hypothetical protein
MFRCSRSYYRYRICFRRYHFLFHFREIIWTGNNLGPLGLFLTIFVPRLNLSNCSWCLMRMHHLCTSVNWPGRPCQMIFVFATSFLNLFTWTVSRAQMLVFLACISWLWQYVYFKWLDQQAYLGYYPWRPLSFPRVALSRRRLDRGGTPPRSANMAMQYVYFKQLDLNTCWLKKW